MGAGIALLGKPTEKEASTAVGRQLAIWANSGPKGIAKAEEAFRRIFPNTPVPDFNPRHFRDILISKNKPLLENKGEETAYHFLDSPFRHAKNIGLGKASVKEQQYTQVHCPGLQRLISHSRTDPTLSKAFPLPKGKPLTVETHGLGGVKVPDIFTMNQRNVVTNIDGQQVSTVPAPGAMRPVIGANNRPIDDAIPWLPHEVPHISSKEVARRKGMEQANKNTYALGLKNDIPVSFLSGSKKPIDQLKQMAMELDAIAKSRAYAKDWERAKVPGLTSKAVQDNAVISMLDPTRGYFSHGKLSDMKNMLAVQPLTHKEIEEIANLLTSLKKQYPHLPKEYMGAINDLIKLVQAKKRPGIALLSLLGFG